MFPIDTGTLMCHEAIPQQKLGFAIYPKVGETQLGKRKVGSGFSREKLQSHKRFRRIVENQENSSACLHLSMLLPGSTDPMPAASRRTQRTHGGCGPPSRWLGGHAGVHYLLILVDTPAQAAEAV